MVIMIDMMIIGVYIHIHGIHIIIITIITIIKFSKTIIIITSNIYTTTHNVNGNGDYLMALELQQRTQKKKSNKILEWTKEF